MPNATPQKEGSCLWKLKGDSKSLLRSNKHLLNQEKYHRALNSGIHSEVFTRNDLDELNKGRLTMLGRLLGDWRVYLVLPKAEVDSGHDIRAREGTGVGLCVFIESRVKRAKPMKSFKKSNMEGHNESHQRFEPGDSKAHERLPVFPSWARSTERVPTLYRAGLSAQGQEPNYF